MTDPLAESRAEIQYEMKASLADAVKVYAKQPLRFQPGAQWSYSNAGQATAGRIVEVVSGEPYEKFFPERILLPLGMQDRFFFPDERRIPRIAALYRAKNGSFASPGGNVLGGDPDKFRKGARYPAPAFGPLSVQVLTHGSRTAPNPYLSGARDPSSMTVR